MSRDAASDPRTPSAGPLSGVRVLEVSRGRPARIAGMLLADLGADVVRRLDPDAAPEPVSPAAVCWDRGKRISPIAAHDVAGAAGQADVVLVDETPSSLPARGWDADTLRAGHPELAHVWLPPYGERGEWCDLPEDPLLLAALGGLAQLYPADDDSPVAPVVAGLTHLHGAIGAAAAVAALLGRERDGVAQPCVVTGLHAAAVLVGTTYTELNGDLPFTASRSSTGIPNWRIYRCADGLGVFLAALTPELFFRALEALGRLDVMALPEVAGDFQAVADVGRGCRRVTAELEPVFASQPSGYWLARFAEARVPCTTVGTRAEWAAGPIVRENGGLRVLPHPVLGAVTVPDVPVTFSGTPAAVRGVARPVPTDPRGPWPPADPDTTADTPASAPAGAPAGLRLPLEGVTVVDAASFVAAPMVSTLLADFGADVVRIEPPGGDTYRAYQLSFLAVNQRKRAVVLDLKAPDGVRALHTLLARADVLVENLRPRAVAALDLGEGDAARFPRLVHCNVSAFGHAEAFADLPGFDPIVQALSGMADAQGGDGGPVVCSAPLNDVTTGALGALGSLAALYSRRIGGRGQRVWVSLAASATFVQSAEFTTWVGSPPPLRGGRLFRGPDEGHRYYACADGWVAVAAPEGAGTARMAEALDVDSPAGAATVLRGHTVASATALLGGQGVPACRVVPHRLPLRDPFWVDNGVSHLVDLPPHGVARVVDAHSRWPAAPAPRAGRYAAPGADNETVFEQEESS
ncbi:CoA transferase [Trujillonella endophytica]|uniref:Crotonobetainyl-CoA:carnitine CoA-transferase CaiB n=1 Tax=Trujillonella endophytica TaxID=673521 RepID=A0A1H8WHK4_9ACTN|nr:CoA transferase [Trujillella endophytica]SEP27145.1 Crotonobetainyl-CoA:carnitine CoA-transferase CaiB [Trujillella endophytica]